MNHVFQVLSSRIVSGQLLWRSLLALAPMVIGVAAAAAAGPTDVLLNEILADPVQDWDQDGTQNFRDDEWVEIVNMSSVPVSLDGYRLAGADTTWRYGFSGTLGPGEVQVVYGSQSLAWEVATGNPQFGLRLSNAGSTVGLWHLSETDTALVDTYAYADHEAEDDRSTGRLPDGGPAWRVFDGLNPHEGDEEPLGTGCAPSPGELHGCATSVESRTWGGLKFQYTP